VVLALERDQRADQRTGFARFHARREQKQQRIKVEFSGTTRFSRRNWATTGAGMPCAWYSPLGSKPGVSNVILFGSVMAKPGATLLKPCHLAPGANSQKWGWLASASVAMLSQGTS